MTEYTKPASQIWAPTTGGGAPRGPVMTEMQTWGTETEEKLAALEEQIPLIVDPLADAFFTTMDIVTAMGSDLPAGRHMEVYRVVKALYDLGAYDDENGLDAFWMLRAHTIEAACINWIDPTKHVLTPVNDPWFFEDIGVQGDSVSSYFQGPHIDNLEKYSTQSACMGVGIGESQFDDDRIDIGFDGSDNAYLSAHNIGFGSTEGARMRSRANYSISESSGFFNTPVGLTAWSRQASGSYSVMAKRGDTSYLATESQTGGGSYAMPDGYFCVGRGGTSATFGTQQMSAHLFVFAFVGGGWPFTTEKRDALYAAIFGDGEED